jgi:hypothetical protein
MKLFYLLILSPKSLSTLCSYLLKLLFKQIRILIIKIDYNNQINNIIYII